MHILGRWEELYRKNKIYVCPLKYRAVAPNNYDKFWLLFSARDGNNENIDISQEKGLLLYFAAPKWTELQDPQ